MLHVPSSCLCCPAWCLKYIISEVNASVGNIGYNGTQTSGQRYNTHARTHNTQERMKYFSLDEKIESKKEKHT